jgi:hypothetical protein
VSLISRSVAWLCAVICLAGCHKKPLDPVVVKGRAVFEGGKPLAEVVLSFYPRDSTNSQQLPAAVTDKDGNFSITCLPGKYTATFNPIPKRHGSTGAAPSDHAVPAKGKGPDAKAIGKYQQPESSPWKIVVPAEGMEGLILKLMP